MANILTASEAATVLRCESNDSNMTAVLPLIDAYLKQATGHDWAADAVIRSEAKSAARMLLVQWHSNPGMMEAGDTAMIAGLGAALVQLEAIALSYKEFFGRNGAGAVSLAGVRRGDTVSTLTGLVGVTGDQHAAFEAVITVDGQIQQISSADLSEKMFRAFILKPGEL
jgi:hypothetical protein